MLSYLPNHLDSYVDWTKADAKDPRVILSRDQAKMNFTWLAFPEVENGVKVLTPEYAEGVHKYMDKQTRSALLTLPHLFMKYWKAIQPDSPYLATFLPEGSMRVMQIRSEEVGLRLLELEKSGNVTSVKFKY